MAPQKHRFALCRFHVNRQQCRGGWSSLCLPLPPIERFTDFPVGSQRNIFVASRLLHDAFFRQGTRIPFAGIFGTLSAQSGKKPLSSLGIDCRATIPSSTNTTLPLRSKGE